MAMASTGNVLGVSVGSMVTGAIGDDLHLGNLPAAVAGGCIVVVALVEACRAGLRGRR